MVLARSHREGKDMTDASVPVTRPIAGVLADVDGTLVTQSKELTARAIGHYLGHLGRGTDSRHYGESRQGFLNAH